MNKFFTNAVCCGLFAVVACSFGSCGKSEADKGVVKEIPAEVATTEVAPVATETVATTEAAPVATETVATTEAAPVSTEVAA